VNVFGEKKLKIGDKYLIQTQHIAEIGTIKEIGEDYVVFADVKVYDLRELVAGIVHPVEGESALTVYLKKNLVQIGKKSLRIKF
jgi:hypothetical protein